MAERQNNLIVVPGHAAFNTMTTPDMLSALPFEAETDPWVLAPFQKGEPHYYGEHMGAGLDLASEDPKSLLIASGGFTRQESVGGLHDWSEASTYLTSAEKSKWFQTDAFETDDSHTAPNGATLFIPKRTIFTPNGAEISVASNEFARDSIENVLGDIATFMALNDGKLPDMVTVVGWKFKTERFKAHAAAIGIPENRFTYVGVNNPIGDDLVGAERGEKKALDAFTADPLGRNYEGDIENPDYIGSLAQKRDDRDPLERGNPHWSMAELIRSGYDRVA